MNVDLVSPELLDPVIVAVRYADIHAGAGAGDLGCRNSGILERAPGGLQQQALLRIHEGGLPRRDAEERRVEQVDAIDEPAPAGDRASRQPRIGIVDAVEIPSVRRNLRDCIASVAPQAPEGL